MNDKDFNKMRLEAENAAQLLKSLAHSTRLMIACSLVDSEMSVGALHQQFSQISQSAFSQHLAVLRNQNIVATRRESQVIFYSLKSPQVIKIIATLNDSKGNTHDSSIASQLPLDVQYYSLGAFYYNNGDYSKSKGYLQLLLDDISLKKSVQDD